MAKSSCGLAGGRTETLGRKVRLTATKEARHSVSGVTHGCCKAPEIKIARHETCKQEWRHEFATQVMRFKDDVETFLDWLSRPILSNAGRLHHLSLASLATSVANRWAYRALSHDLFHMPEERL